VHAKGGEGGLELAKKVLEAASKWNDYKPLYDVNDPIKKKIEAIATEIYGAEGVTYTDSAEHDITHLQQHGLDKMPVCISKTQKSLSDDPALLGRPRGFKISVNTVKASAGAGFIVAMTGKVMTMPGLPKKPAAEVIDIDDDGIIHGLF
jgi:formate--tetrahydrofolate ligase